MPLSFGPPFPLPTFPLKALISLHFLPHFFLLQLNPTYMKRILHLVSVKNITFKSSYNWFKINIHQQLRKVWKYFLAFNVQSIIRKDGWIQNLFKDTEKQWQKTKCHLIALLPINMHSEKCANLRFYQIEGMYIGWNVQEAENVGILAALKISHFPFWFPT